MGETEGYLPFPKGFETMCIHHTEKLTKGHCVDIVAPIISSNICRKQDSKGHSQYVKGRLVNPTRSALEHLLAVLNKAKYGLCFSSGLGAVTAVLGLLKHGDHVICTDDLYAGTTRLFYEMAPRFGINTSFIDFDDLNNVRDAIKPETKLIWTENPTNPKMKIVDLFCISELSREQNILVTNDNTLLTPYFQRPLEYGVDIVMHSLSKYLNGHSDVIMGCVCTNSKDLFQKMRYLQTHFGHVPSPFDCFQVIRGIKTLPQRMIRHQQNALEVAKYLSDHPKIEQVMHPGLPSHPQHALFKKQTSGHSGMFSFYLKGGIKESNNLLSNLEVFTQAVSFGGYESLIEIPSLLSHKATPEELKDKLKYTENLLRISVGLENVCDLINDLDNALKKV